MALPWAFDFFEKKTRRIQNTTKATPPRSARECLEGNHEPTGGGWFAQEEWASLDKWRSLRCQGFK